MSVIYTWGSTADERAEVYPCDRLIPAPFVECFRAVDVAAPIPLTFRWLCQLRVAPYSYDWIDNWGRTSPRQRDPQNERLENGQRWMTIFRLVEFELERHLTLVVDRTSVFGSVACTYALRPSAVGSRIVVKLTFWHRAKWMRWFLPAGDLIMMRRQLLNLKELAEREHSRSARAPEQTRPAVT
jgi:hypothetical protein